MEDRGHRAHLQRAGEGRRTGARPGCIVPAKAVDELDVVLDLSLDSKLAGHVLIQGINSSFQRTCHDKRSVWRHGQGIGACRGHVGYGV